MNTKTSALDALRGLSKKNVASSAAISTQVNDPSISGAKRDRNTVKLGFDPAIAQTAKQAAELHDALARAEAEFTIVQGQMRDYGIQKRGLYNGTFKCDVTTVAVPYLVEGPQQETKYVQVVATRKWSVEQNIVRGAKDLLGTAYERMFVTETTKSLKPNAEELIRNLLTEVAGLSGEDLEATMTQLFDEKTVIKARGETFEEEYNKLPETARAVLDQAVTRSAPALKF